MAQLAGLRLRDRWADWNREPRYRQPLAGLCLAEARAASRVILRMLPEVSDPVRREAR